MSLLSPSQYYRLRSVVVYLARRSTLVQASWLFQTLGSLPFLDDLLLAKVLNSNIDIDDEIYIKIRLWRHKKFTNSQDRRQTRETQEM